MARVSALRAIGSCTFVTSCQVLDPAAVAASTVVGGRPRMPSAMIFMATGAANTTAATIAVNRLAPKSARNGTR